LSRRARKRLMHCNKMGELQRRNFCRSEPPAASLWYDDPRSGRLRNANGRTIMRRNA
jgi:hypothetical protein